MSPRTFLTFFLAFRRLPRLLTGSWNILPTWVQKDGTLATSGGYNLDNQIPTCYHTWHNWTGAFHRWSMNLIWILRKAGHLPEGLPEVSQIIFFQMIWGFCRTWISLKHREKSQCKKQMRARKRTIIQCWWASIPLHSIQKTAWFSGGYYCRIVMYYCTGSVNTVRCCMNTCRFRFCQTEKPSFIWDGLAQIILQDDDSHFTTDCWGAKVVYQARLGQNFHFQNSNN